MKRVLLSIVSIIFTILALAQDESFSYQTIVHNSEGKVVATHPVSLKFSIIAGTAYDTVVYSERHSVTTSQLGLVSVTIGNGTDKSGNFTAIDWSAEKYFLKVEIDITGGTNYTDMSTTQILNIPVASPSKENSRVVPEDRMFISRKYAGNFLDYRQTGPNTSNGPNLIWIKTSLENTFGKISAYGRKCAFSTGDKLYLRRTYYSPGGITGYWVYQIENDSSVYYRLSDFQHDRKVPVETWFK